MQTPPDNLNYSIRVKNLSKIYRLYEKHSHRMREALHPLGKTFHKRFYALRDVNLTVKRGEILGIIGRNGAGKSTLLQILSGVLEPSSGSVDVQGNVTALLELGTGFNPELTGMENIYFHGTINGYSRQDMNAMVDTILDFAEIGDFVFQPLKTYSSGMRTRLGFAVAAHMNPQILILDEVLAVGDELFKRKCYAKMEEIFQQGCTVLYVSHSLASIKQICSRVVFMDAGELILEGSPKLVTTRYLSFLYARKEQQAQEREKLKRINGDPVLKNQAEKDMGPLDDILPEGPGDTAIKDSPGIPADGPKGDGPQALFLPEFTPRSTVIIRNHDVEIIEPRILSENRQPVNYLVTGEKYMLSFRLRFNQPAEMVTCGMVVKALKGFRLGAHEIKVPGKDNGLITAGSSFAVQWHFKCALLNGNYFISLDVSSHGEEEPDLLLRIEDALAFKVQETAGAEYRGFVHFNQTASIKQVE